MVPNWKKKFISLEDTILCVENPEYTTNKQTKLELMNAYLHQRAFLVAQMVNNLPVMWEIQV